MFETSTRICDTSKYYQEQENFKCEAKNGIFRSEFEKTIVIFEISALEFIIKCIFNQYIELLHRVHFFKSSGSGSAL